MKMAKSSWPFPLAIGLQENLTDITFWFVARTTSLAGRIWHRHSHFFSKIFLSVFKWLGYVDRFRFYEKFYKFPNSGWILLALENMYLVWKIENRYLLVLKFTFFVSFFFDKRWGLLPQLWGNSKEWRGQLLDPSNALHWIVKVVVFELVSK